MVRPDRPGVRPDRSGQGSGLSGRPDRPAGLRQPWAAPLGFSPKVPAHGAEEMTIKRSNAPIRIQRAISVKEKESAAGEDYQAPNSDSEGNQGSPSDTAGHSGEQQNVYL